MKSSNKNLFSELAEFLEADCAAKLAKRSGPTDAYGEELGTGRSGIYLARIVSELGSVLRDLSCCPDSATSMPGMQGFGHDRPMPGYEPDELFRELNRLRRHVLTAARDFFSRAAMSLGEQFEAKELVEDFFEVRINSAIRQLIDGRNERVAASIAERDRAVASQQKSEDRLRMATSAASMGVFEWDVATQVGLWESARMYEITGQPESQGPLSCREFMHALVHPEDMSALLPPYRKAMQSGDDFHTAFRILRISDRALRVVEMHGAFRTRADGAKTSFVGTLADITDRTHAEQALREADQRKNAFLAMLAHEIRNPLAPIRNAAQILKRLPEAVSPEIDWVQAIIERQCAHLTRLIDDLLDVSRISSGKIHLCREVFDLKIALQSAVEINEPAAQAHGNRIEVAVPLEPVFVNGDRTRLTQVLSNLLDNAIKYSTDGSDISLHLTAGDGQVELIVSDTGIGIPSQHLTGIFEPYVQFVPVDGRRIAGLGIGLALVRNLMNMHGGDVTANSEGMGKGSQFTITLPMAAAPVLESTGPVLFEEPPVIKLRILLVDDNVDAVESLSIILEEHEIQCAYSGEDALVIAQRFHADIAILDIGLPGISGHELARQLRLIPGNARTILLALSGFGAPEDFIRSREAGFREHFVKPVNPGKLIDFLLTEHATQRPNIH